MIAAHDGGCLIPDCPAPPGWCETRHIHPWSEGGRTDVDDGVLLCRFHHLMLHTNHWSIHRDTDGDYLAIPPPEVDPRRTPIPLPSKNPLGRRISA